MFLFLNRNKIVGSFGKGASIHLSGLNFCQTKICLCPPCCKSSPTCLTYYIGLCHRVKIKIKNGDGDGNGVGDGVGNGDGNGDGNGNGNGDGNGDGNGVGDSNGDGNGYGGCDAVFVIIQVILI